MDPTRPTSPNATLVVGGAAANEEVLVVELTNPRYDADAGALDYDTAPLAGGAGGGLVGLAARQQDTEVPATFGPSALFIDDIWCILNPRRK